MSVISNVLESINERLTVNHSNSRLIQTLKTADFVRKADQNSKKTEVLKIPQAIIIAAIVMTLLLNQFQVRLLL